jgi:hypothetical protein
MGWPSVPIRRWFAVSNHETHSVLLYQQGPSLTADSEPDGILRCVTYPHGLRFSADGYHLFVADAGAPICPPAALRVWPPRKANAQAEAHLPGTCLYEPATSGAVPETDVRYLCLRIASPSVMP